MTAPKVVTVGVFDVTADSVTVEPLTKSAVIEFGAVALFAADLAVVEAIGERIVREARRLAAERKQAQAPMRGVGS